MVRIVEINEVDCGHHHTKLIMGDCDFHHKGKKVSIGPCIWYKEKSTICCILYKRRKFMKEGWFECNWSSLPQELLEKIVELFTENVDYVRFQAVCKNWRFVLPSSHHLPCQIPWLMLPSKDDATRYGGDFFSLFDNKIYHIDLPSYAKRCVGSSQGWLCFAYMEANIITLSLLNPLTKGQIQLPPLTTFPGFTVRAVGGVTLFETTSEKYEPETYTLDEMLRVFFTKLVLSENPTSNKYVASLLYDESHCLAFCRAGDAKWWCVKDHLCGYEFYHDIVFRNGQFYCLLAFGTVLVLNANPYDPSLKVISRFMDPFYATGDVRYLVDVAGELVMVTRRRMYIHPKPKTLWFRVHRFTPQSDDEWTKLTSLGDFSLFVGTNHSFSLSINHLPKGCKPNRIYFTDHFDECNVSLRYGGDAIGVYNMEDKSFEPLPCCVDESKWFWPPPIWITPSLF